MFWRLNRKGKLCVVYQKDHASHQPAFLDIWHLSAQLLDLFRSVDPCLMVCGTRQWTANSKKAVTRWEPRGSVRSSSDHFVAGVKGLGMGLVGGLTSIVTQPIEGAHNAGLSVSSLSRARLMCKPVNLLLENKPKNTLLPPRWQRNFSYVVNGGMGAVT